MRSWWHSSIIGVAALLAATLAGGAGGDALGQVFRAEDMLITKLTVWRRPNNRSVIGANLYITGVDTT